MIRMQGRHTCLVTGLMLALLTVACGGSGGFTALGPPNGPPQPTATPQSVQIEPSQATLVPLQVVQFKASVVPNGADQAVQWFLPAGCDPDHCGTVDNTGKYTAPKFLPGSPTLMLRAIAVALPQPETEASIRIIAPPEEDNSRNYSLQGQYAVLVGTAFNSVIDERQALAATLYAYGDGTVSGVCDDPGHSQLGGALVGHYAIAADYRARLTLQCGGGPTRTLRVAFIPPVEGEPASKGHIIQLGYPSEDLSAGMIARQDPSAFSKEALAGDYAFSLGPMIGRFTLGYSEDFAETLFLGQLDLRFGSYEQRNLSFLGFYEVDADGRGRLSVGGLPQQTMFSPFQPVDLRDLLVEFRFYVISSDELVLLPTFSKTGCCPVGPAVSVGLAHRQSGLPLSNESLTGNAVLLDSRADSEQHVYLVGKVALDGAGAFNGSGDRFSVWFEFEESSLHETNVPIAGVYSLAPDGLGGGSITINGTENPLYVVRPGRALLGFNSTPTHLEVGAAGPFDDGALTGDYAVGTPMPPFWGRTAGSFKSGGNGTGQAVLDSFVVGVSGSVVEDKATVTYTTASDGRTVFVFTDADGNHWSAVFYLLSPSKAVGIWTHAAGSGVLER